MKTILDSPLINFDFSQWWDHLPPKWEERLGAADTKARKRYASGEVGFFDWPNQITVREIQAIENTAKALRKDFRAALCIGIGGSYLGAAAAMQALRTPAETDDFPVHWITNTDPAAIHAADSFLKKNPNCATIVISKSGNTVETLSAFFHFSSRIKKNGIIAITDPKKGELRRLAEQEHWKSFPVPPALGGRFSVLSAVGLFPCELAGISAASLIDGAKEMRSHLLLQPLIRNPAALFALLTWAWDTGQQVNQHYFMPYWSSLTLLSQWLVQLWAESLGKMDGDKKRVGFTPIAALGTLDQHSVLQLMKEGPLNKIVGFIDVASDQPTSIDEPTFKISEEFAYLTHQTFDKITHSALAATSQSLNNSGIPTYQTVFKEMSAKALGGFYFFHEAACALAGELYEINAFDQPGVEESKKLLKEMLI